ncbi:MAG: SDR family oxidoreductase [Burkholderiales bacterium]|nr:SDR family oxidoreductase [Burkholderiales bacterium]
MQRFQDRTVVVTGGGGGIGGATCRRFAAEGARVAVFDLNLDAAEKVAAAIRAEGGQARALRCDITDRASVDAAVAAAEKALGPIEVLVNNAGWDVFKPFLKTVPAEWERLIAITVNVVCPGPTDTALLAGVAEGARDPAKLLEACSAIPLGRLGQPDDLAGAIAFFGSDDASFVTGQVVSVSGGLTMHG